MKIIFMDESGYVSNNWDSPENLEVQPYYVVSAVVIPFENYKVGSKKLREEISILNLPGANKPLGLGFEIKAKDIATGKGYWGTHNEERNKVRNLMLSFPKDNSGHAIVTVIDKKAHFNKYVNPEYPYKLALQFIFERIQHHLDNENEEGIIIYDLNHRLEPGLSSEATALIRDGSQILTYDVLGFPYEFRLNINKVLEFAFARSENSIGLIVADFFASMAYQYHKEGKPIPCGWWDLLWESLDKCNDGRVEGCGYKLFPEEEQL